MTEPDQEPLPYRLDGRPSERAGGGFLLAMLALLLGGLVLIVMLIVMLKRGGQQKPAHVLRKAAPSGAGEA